MDFLSSSSPFIPKGPVSRCEPDGASKSWLRLLEGLPAVISGHLSLGSLWAQGAVMLAVKEPLLVPSPESSVCVLAEGEQGQQTHTGVPEVLRLASVGK